MVQIESLLDIENIDNFDFGQVLQIISRMEHFSEKEIHNLIKFYEGKFQMVEKTCQQLISLDHGIWIKWIERRNKISQIISLLKIALDNISTNHKIENIVKEFGCFDKCIKFYRKKLNILSKTYKRTPYKEELSKSLNKEIMEMELLILELETYRGMSQK